MNPYVQHYHYLLLSVDMNHINLTGPFSRRSVSPSPRHKELSASLFICLLSCGPLSLYAFSPVVLLGFFSFASQSSSSSPNLLTSLTLDLLQGALNLATNIV